MASPTGNRERDRAVNFGALLRKKRRAQGWAIAVLAEKIPMSASNLSRVELGDQGPPAAEVIESIAAALEEDPAELLKAAGRASGRRGFEETVLEQLAGIRRDVQEVKDAVKRRA